jgi:hypothetical protein
MFIQLTALVHKKRLLPSRRMSPHNRMLIFHWLPPHNPLLIPTKLRLLEPTMYSLQPMQPLLQRLTEPIVRLDLVREYRVTGAIIGRVENVQESRSGRLGLVCHVAVERDAAVAACEEGVEFGRSGGAVSVNDVQFGMALWTSARGMDVVASKIPAEVERFLERQIGEILVAECYYFPLSDEESELVFAGGVELVELHSRDFGADAWGELFDFAVIGEEVLEGWVGVFAVLGVGEGLQGRVLLAVVPGWEVFWVLGGVSDCFPGNRSRDLPLHLSFHLLPRFVSLLWANP